MTKDQMASEFAKWVVDVAQVKHGPMTAKEATIACEAWITSSMIRIETICLMLERVDLQVLASMIREDFSMKPSP